MLAIKNVSFSYNQIPTLKNINFNVENGQNIAIIGESGCGKSTLLKLIYGLYDLNDGAIIFEGNQVLGPKNKLIAGEENIKYLAQDFGLMPYITVAENVGKFLSNSDKNKKQIRINELLEIVEMTEFSNTKAQFLSGGQQQRVALAMVIAKKPKLLLLDEPFSQIDSFRKNNLRRNLFHYLKRNNITCIIATHDCNDALSFSDETIVLRNGEIVAKNNSKTLFQNPENKYIGSLFGDINEIEINGKIKLIYSHQLKITKNSDLKVIVKKNYFRGNHYLIEATYNDKALFFDSEIEILLNSEIYLNFSNKYI